MRSGLGSGLESGLGADQMFSSVEEVCVSLGHGRMSFLSLSLTASVINANAKRTLDGIDPAIVVYRR